MSATLWVSIHMLWLSVGRVSRQNRSNDCKLFDKARARKIMIVSVKKNKAKRMWKMPVCDTPFLPPSPRSRSLRTRHWQRKLLRLHQGLPLSIYQVLLLSLSTLHRSSRERVSQQALQPWQTPTNYELDSMCVSTPISRWLTRMNGVPKSWTPQKVKACFSSLHCSNRSGLSVKTQRQ